jgi:hypothetical protein
MIMETRAKVLNFMPTMVVREHRTILEIASCHRQQIVGSSQILTWTFTQRPLNVPPVAVGDTKMQTTTSKQIAGMIAVLVRTLRRTKPHVLHVLRESTRIRTISPLARMTALLGRTLLPTKHHAPSATWHAVLGSTNIAALPCTITALHI